MNAIEKNSHCPSSAPALRRCAAFPSFIFLLSWHFMLFFRSYSSIILFCSLCLAGPDQNRKIYRERLFAVHGLSERTTVQTSSLLLRLFFFYLLANPTQPDPTRPISLTLTQTPTPADPVVPIHSWCPLGHSTVWADFVCVSGSVLYLVRTKSKK